MKPTLSFVVPIFNEQECVPEMLSRFKKLKEQLAAYDFSILFVDDGSSDSTYSLIARASREFDFVKVIKLSRNFGHQMALTAGLDHVDADYVCIIDGDLQDPPELVIPMLQKMTDEQAEVIYGQRSARKGESYFKLLTAAAFYRLINAMCRIDIPKDTGDFRLITRKVVENFKTLRERHRFIRGMVPWLGFKMAAFPYERDARFAGETKYPLSKMVKFAIDAILSFSNTPLRMASYFGLATIVIGVVGGLFMLYIKLFTSRFVPGVTVILLSLVIISGVQILMLGLLGEYVGRIFEESKNRPLYLVDQRINVDDIKK